MTDVPAMRPWPLRSGTSTPPAPELRKVALRSRNRALRAGWAGRSLGAGPRGTGWPSGDRTISRELRPVHDTAGAAVEGVAPVQHTEVVTNNGIGHPPVVGDGETGLGSVLPNHVEKCSALRHRSGRQPGSRYRSSVHFRPPLMFPCILISDGRFHRTSTPRRQLDISYGPLRPNDSLGGAGVSS